ncbi:MAG: sugar phosphate nucleotidyltransferase [Planctomycetota bacterium]
MKVVLFCGGLGMRLRDYSEDIPKPLVPIGYRPILWHVMKYYASFGHKDFILCLGYKADFIKNYFLNYNECLSNDFVLSEGGKKIDLLRSDIADWRIHFADTGFAANIGQRLKAVEEHLRGEEMFLANYSDGLTDFHLPTLVDHMQRTGKIAGMLCVPPTHTFHVVGLNANNEVTDIKDIKNSGLWINGGYFCFRREIFDHMKPGEELVQEPFERLSKRGQLVGHKYTGFWAAMETFKDKRTLDEMYARGEAPWEVWRK